MKLKKYDGKSPLYIKFKYPWGDSSVVGDRHFIIFPTKQYRDENALLLSFHISFQESSTQYGYVYYGITYSDSRKQLSLYCKANSPENLFDNLIALVQY